MLPIFDFWDFVKIIQIYMAYFHIRMISYQDLEPSLIKDQICQKILTQLKYGATWN